MIFWGKSRFDILLQSVIIKYTENQQKIIENLSVKIGKESTEFYGVKCEIFNDLCGDIFVRTQRKNVILKGICFF